MAALSTAPRLVAQGKGRAATKKGDEDEKISLAENLTSCLYRIDQCNNCLEAYVRNCGMLPRVFTNEKKCQNLVILSVC